MKKTFLYWILLCSFIDSKAQINLDSLWDVWSNVNFEDSSRLSALSEYAYEGVLDSNPDSAYYLAELMLEYATIKGIRVYQANAYRLFGEIVVRKR